VPDRQNEDDAMRATAHLPGLDIEIMHRKLPAAEGEQISINLQAMPSFEAFGRFLETLNPFVFWAQAVQLMWLPWLNTARVLMPPMNAPPTQPELNSGSTEADRG
jgi:hypothetical protein